MLTCRRLSPQLFSVVLSEPSQIRSSNADRVHSLSQDSQAKAGRCPVFHSHRSRDLIRDNKQQALLSERLKTLEARHRRLEELLQIHLPYLANGESLFPQLIAIGCVSTIISLTASFWRKFEPQKEAFWKAPSLTAS